MKEQLDEACPELAKLSADAVARLIINGMPDVTCLETILDYKFEGVVFCEFGIDTIATAPRMHQVRVSIDICSREKAFELRAFLDDVCARYNDISTGNLQAAVQVIESI